MNIVKYTVSASIAVAAALLACASAQAAPACPSVSSVQSRIVEHANGDIEALRAFVWKTAIIYRINMVDVRDNLDAWRAAVDCRSQAAADEHAVPVADAAGAHVAAR